MKSIYSLDQIELRRQVGYVRLRYFRLICHSETIMGAFLKDTSAIKMPDCRFTLDHLPANYT